MCVHGYVALPSFSWLRFSQADTPVVLLSTSLSTTAHQSFSARSFLCLTAVVLSTLIVIPCVTALTSFAPITCQLWSFNSSLQAFFLPTVLSTEQQRYIHGSAFQPPAYTDLFQLTSLFHTSVIRELLYNKPVFNFLSSSSAQAFRSCWVLFRVKWSVNRTLEDRTSRNQYAVTEAETDAAG